MYPDARTWIAALRSSHERLASLVAGRDPAWLDSPSYDEGWSVAQVLSHLGSGAEIAGLMLTSALGGPVTDREAFGPIWETWNAKAPAEQAASCLAADAAHISRLEALSDGELARMSVEAFGLRLDAAGLVGLRLGEHALHTWDVAVTLDPAAQVSPDAVTLLAGSLPLLAGRFGRADGETLRVRLRTGGTEDHLLTVTGSVALEPWPADGGEGADGEVALTAEALLRLVYGRLDAAHTPPAVTATGVDLDRIRKVFPGF